MSEVTNKQIYELLLGMKSDLADVKKKVNTIQEHVARIDERLTETEKVKNIFNPKMLEKI